MRCVVLTAPRQTARRRLPTDLSLRAPIRTVRGQLRFYPVNATQLGKVSPMSTLNGVLCTLVVLLCLVAVVSAYYAARARRVKQEVRRWCEEDDAERASSGWFWFAMILAFLIIVTASADWLQAFAAIGGPELAP
jgi:Ca2+/Na+ antiporter